VFRFINETQKDVVDLFPYEGAQSQEFPVDAVENRFQEVAFAWIFRVKKLQEL